MLRKTDLPAASPSLGSGVHALEAALFHTCQQVLFRGASPRGAQFNTWPTSSS